MYDCTLWLTGGYFRATLLIPVYAARFCCAASFFVVFFVYVLRFSRPSSLRDMVGAFLPNLVLVRSRGARPAVGFRRSHCRQTIGDGGDGDGVFGERWPFSVALLQAGDKGKADKEVSSVCVRRSRSGVGSRPRRGGGGCDSPAIGNLAQAYALLASSFSCPRCVDGRSRTRLVPFRPASYSIDRGTPVESTLGA